MNKLTLKNKRETFQWLQTLLKKEDEKHQKAMIKRLHKCYTHNTGADTATNEKHKPGNTAGKMEKKTQNKTIQKLRNLIMWTVWTFRSSHYVVQ